MSTKQNKQEKNDIINITIADIKKIEKINIILLKIKNKIIIEILFRSILNVDNENCVLNVLKIFGLCGAIDQKRMNSFFNENNIKYLYEIDSNYRSIEGKGIEIITFNNKLEQYEEIDISFTDPSNIKAVLYSMELLKMNKQQDLSIKIISSLKRLIKAITEKESNLIDIILPTIIQIIPKFPIEQQKILFECIRVIMNNFEDKTKKYLDDIIPFIINYYDKNYLDIIGKKISLLYEKYKNEFEKYYSLLIQKDISIIKGDDEDYNQYNKIFLLFIKNNEISPYFKILAEEIKIKFYKETNPKNIYGILCITE